MNKEIQAKIDEKIEEGNVPAETREPFRVVETSKHPVLGADLLKRKGKKVYVVEGFIDEEPFKIGVRRGIPLEYQLMLNVTADIFALRSDKKTEGEEASKSEEEIKDIIDTNRKIHQITVASTMVLIDEEENALMDPDTGEFIPLFSIDGVGGEMPIEDLSDLLLKHFYELVMEVQAPKAAADVLNRFQRTG